MLTPEESLLQNKQEIIDYTEDVLDARGIECDERIEKMSEEQLKDVLEEVRRLRAKKKQKKKQSAGRTSRVKYKPSSILPFISTFFVWTPNPNATMSYHLILLLMTLHPYSYVKYQIKEFCTIV